MKYSSIFFITGFIVLFLFCENQSPLKPDYQRVVIQAYLFNGEVVDDVHLTETIPLGGETDTPPPINDATVTLIKNSQTYELTPSGGDSGYYNDEKKDLTLVQTGDQFTIQVECFGHTATGSTTVPPQPSGVTQSGDTIFMPKYSLEEGKSFTFDITKHQVTFSWDYESDAMYFITIKNIEDNPVMVEKGFPRRGLPAGLEGLPINENSYPVIFESIVYYGKHEVTIYRVNQEYVDMYNSRVQNARELNEPLTNIQNGLGVFSAFNNAKRYFWAVRDSIPQ